MAGSPRWKVFNSDGIYIASTTFIEDAAALIAFNGYGASIRDGYNNRRIVWREGSESQLASESYDNVVAVVTERTS